MSETPVNPLELTQKALRELRDARRRVNELKEERARLLATVTASPEYTSLSEELALAEQAEDAFENAVREGGLYLFTATQNKKPVSGLEIKWSTEFWYDQKIATEWCRTNFTPALVLDKKLFERAAKAGSLPASVVSVTETPKVYIASDLDKALEGE